MIKNFSILILSICLISSLHGADDGTYPTASQALILWSSWKLPTDATVGIINMATVADAQQLVKSNHSALFCRRICRSILVPLATATSGLAATYTLATYNSPMAPLGLIFTLAGSMFASARIDSDVKNINAIERAIQDKIQASRA